MLCEILYVCVTAQMHTALNLNAQNLRDVWCKKIL